jgi:hypothetical protein
MDPGNRTTPRKPTEPPLFTSDTDKFKWRKDVRSWVRLVKRMAQGGCSKAKAVNNALGESLYLAVDDAGRNKLDRAIASGILTMDSEEAEMDQEDIVNTIIKVIAADSPTDGIKRLVSMLQDVHSCKRKQSEDPASYARRFEGLASLYLNNCHSHSADQDSQLFAMILLENAQLPAGTFDNIILQLISTANTR